LTAEIFQGVCQWCIPTIYKKMCFGCGWWNIYLHI